MRVLVVGATGAVGSKALQLALEGGFSEVHALTRKPIDEASFNADVNARVNADVKAKVINHVVDFDSLSGDEPCWQVDSVICALGTTLKQAGSKSRFFTIEHDYVMNVARFAFQAGAKHFLYVSSIGANVDSKQSYYLSVKGLIEQHLQAVGFEQLTVLRPSLLAAENRPDTRVAESVGLWVNRYLSFMLPRALRAIKVERVARCLIAESLAITTGKTPIKIIEVNDI